MSLISGIEKFYASEGYVKFFYRKDFVSQFRKISYRNPSLLCFRKFLVAKKFFDKRGGGYQDFESKNFCFTVPKSFLGYPFRVSLISDVEKFYASEGHVTIICRNFLSHSAEKLRTASF